MTLKIGGICLFICLLNCSFNSCPGQVQQRWKQSNTWAPLNISVTQNISKLLNFILPDLSVLKPLRQAFRRSEESARSVAICQACQIGLSAVVDYVRTSSNPKSILDFARISCPLLPLEREACYRVIRDYGEIFIYIIRVRRDLPPDRMCGMFLQFYGCVTSDPNIYWDVLSEMGYSRKARRPEVVNRQSSKNSEGRPSLKVLQLTDIHLDRLYSPGSRAQCRKEICCRGSNVTRKYSEFEAGFYGDYRFCDLPLHTFENALEHMAETHPDIDMIYMTGDLAPHTGIAVKSSVEEVKDDIKAASEMIYKYFPNTPVIPVIGNHDTYPGNLFSPPSFKNKFSTNWVYETAAKAWVQWLPAESLETFLYGGFYSKIVNPDLRVIVLNNNVCLATNFWQAIEDRDPFGQLHWLVEQLQEAENFNQKVHILGHVPPNFEMCWNIWSDNYYRIIARFSNTVKAQFFGHTHFDDFGLYYDPVEIERPINSYFIGASLTPYVNLNPGYKIYTVDGAAGVDSTYDVLDHETWIFNLTKANLSPDDPPEWYRLYSAKEVYGLEDLSPVQLHSFVKRMWSNETAFKEFYRYFFKAAITKMSETCDATCRKSRLCNIFSPTFKEYSRCVLLEYGGQGEALPRSVFGGQDSYSRSYPGFSAGLEPWAGLRVIGPLVKAYGF